MRILQKMKQQSILFFYALSYFTRLPIPGWVVFDNNQFHKANAYLPLIGVINALFMVIVFYLCQLLFPIPISLILMLIASLLLTGGLHEDGFADCCDGFGGGYDATQRLKIMKDSQIGSYGGLGLVLLFLLKFNVLLVLAQFGVSYLVVALFCAHILSRYCALCLMQSLPYMRLEGGGKVEGLATKLKRRYFLFSSLSAVPILLFFSLSTALAVVITVALVTLLLRNLFINKVGGYTGDCLGFSQQLIENVVFLLLIAVLAQ